MISNSQNKQNIPWVEKYRPTQFDDIVLDPINRRIFQNILTRNYFPNLMFYGPPGTGKTTTIINLINEYQQRHNQVNKGSVIHLNASDERGIDIIRNQIYQFVKSKNFFEAGLKFVILDEVDYMTKNAQQALKYLLQSSCYNVRFCLICNYISKIDESLKNEFTCIRFNQLPRQDIFKFIKQITHSENLELSDAVIDTIQKLYNSDIRSMINFIQLNQNNTEWESNIITDNIWEKIHELLCLQNHDVTFDYINNISIQYNTDKKTLMKNYFNYIIRNKKELVTKKLLTIIEGAMHVTDSNIQHILQYFIHHLSDFYANN
uniref:AAA+ ATPase domain-containing protein n=1 Tax=viral metagenome TaxID=1070528 RepID=A0A6C0JMG6_9ZZZZ